MSLRTLEEAELELDAARPECETVKEQEECSRLEQLLTLLHTFWSAVEEGWGALQPKEELKIDNQRFVVVKVDPTSLVLSSADKESTYTLSDLPGNLAVLLASRKLRADASSTYLCLGAFHAMDRCGDRKQALAMWNQATNAGGFSPKLLLPELKKPK